MFCSSIYYIVLSIHVHYSVMYVHLFYGNNRSPYYSLHTGL
jgi:hypothetical protein